MPFCAGLPRLLDSLVDRAQRKMGSAALVLGLILVAASVHFASVSFVRIALDSCDLGLTIGFVKIIEKKKELNCLSRNFEFRK